MRLADLPAVGSRWQLPDYPGSVFEVVVHNEYHGFPYAKMRTVIAGQDSEHGLEFEVELAWFEHRKATEVKS